MRLSLHAAERWADRCPHLDVKTELATARPMSKRMRNLLKYPHFFPGKRYYITPGGALLVVNDFLVLTVMHVAEAKRRARTKARRALAEA